MAERRILLFLTDLEVGGTPTVVRELASRLRAFAHVTVGCLKPAGPVAESIRSGGVDVISLETTRPHQLRIAVGTFREVVRIRRIDTVLSFLVHANTTAACAASRLPGVRFFQSIQTVQPKPAWHWRVQAWAARRCQGLVVPSRAIVNAAVERCGIPADRFTVIPNAVDPADYVPRPVFAGDPLRVGFIGRLDPVKRIEVAIAAARQIDDASLLIFGEGPERRRLESPDDGNVEWRGTVASPQVALREIDVLLLPSLGEGFGLVLIEAMAAGVPVVASAAGGILDVIEHERNGLLIPPGPGEVEGFAGAIRKLRDDEAMRARLIAQGLATVRERFNWAAVLPKYRELLAL